MEVGFVVGKVPMLFHDRSRDKIVDFFERALQRGLRAEPSILFHAKERCCRHMFDIIFAIDLQPMVEILFEERSRSVTVPVCDIASQRVAIDMFESLVSDKLRRMTEHESALPSQAARASALWDRSTPTSFKPLRFVRRDPNRATDAIFEMGLYEKSILCTNGVMLEAKVSTHRSER